MIRQTEFNIWTKPYEYKATDNLIFRNNNVYMYNYTQTSGEPSYTKIAGEVRMLSNRLGSFLRVTDHIEFLMNNRGLRPEEIFVGRNIDIQTLAIPNIRERISG